MTTAEPEISVPVADCIASWRRVFVGRKNGVDVRDLLRRAAGELWQMLEIDRTAHPESHIIARQDAVDALQELAESSGIGTDDAQFILEESFKAPSSNGAEKAKEAPNKSNAIVQVGEWVRNFGDAADPLIEDIDGGEIIGRAQQGVLYGPQGTGKTAVAIELAHAIATGSGMGIQHLTAEPVYRSMKGRVLFAIYEDPYDFRRRMIALAQVRGVDLDVLDWAIVSADLNVTREHDRASLLQENPQRCRSE